MRESFSELFPPRRIGRYEIVDRLGAGGMAEVLLAIRQGAVGFKKAVALKRILPQYAKESQFVQMLAREAAIAAMLHHPN
ncbi:MAG: hypothetical protein IT379_15135, partial [Deltaproteobacteria bacterium]|nr:hypothetical protein [Deltaproteobacteria bacterium]